MPAHPIPLRIDISSAELMDPLVAAPAVRNERS